jgi:hypothetical protein
MGIDICGFRNADQRLAQSYSPILSSVPSNFPTMSFISDLTGLVCIVLFRFKALILPRLELNRNVQQLLCLIFRNGTDALTEKIDTESGSNPYSFAIFNASSRYLIVIPPVTIPTRLIFLTVSRNSSGHYQ